MLVRARAGVRARRGAPPLTWLLLLAMTSAAGGQAIQDSRCYLMNGGAVESFFISEDMPVGSVIGTLSVNGDPSEEDGNISLKLQEKDAAIGIAPGTKNITLLRQLDREEKSGPSNVYVNVRCDRRRTTDPSFVIPVSVRVWDVNDNAPAWVGAPYSVRLSELTAVGSRVLQSARATDADQPGPHATVHYTVVDGPYSEYFSFPNELDSILVLQKPLDFESLSNFSVVLRAADQGRPPRHNDTTLAVEVMDADDQNPKFSFDHYTAVMPEDAKEGTQLAIGPGPIAAIDQDLGINAPLYYSSKGDMVAIDKDSGRVACTAKLIAESRPVTVVIKATQYDNADRYALATLSVTPARAARGAGGLRLTQRAYSAAVPEDAPLGSVLLTLHTNRDRDQSPLQFYVSDRTFLEKFAINSAGELLLRRALDYESEEHYHYQVMVTDGAQNDTASINITVLNVNDWEPRFKHAQYEFQLQEGAADAAGGLLRVGRLHAHDGDRGDYVQLSLRGPDSSLFYINDLGEMFMKQEALSTLNTSVVHVVATAIDSGTPPRQSSVPVLVHVPAAMLAARAGGGGGGAVLAVFACALAALAALVLALLGYIYRNKRLKSSAGTTKPTGGFVQQEKVPEGTLRDSHQGPRTLGAAPSGSLLSVSAGASTILANSSSSLDLRGGTLPNNGSAGTVGRQSQRFPTKSKIAPAPPVPADSTGGAGAGAAGAARMSDHIHAGAGRSGVAWPSATIPARVKKLSWDDADRETKLQMNGDMKPSSEVHDATNPAVAEHMNLTVYF